MFGVILTKIHILWKVYLWFKKFLLSPHPSKFRPSGPYFHQSAVSIIFMPQCSQILVNINLAWHKFRSIINILGNISPLKLYDSKTSMFSMVPTCSFHTWNFLCGQTGEAPFFFFPLHCTDNFYSEVNKHWHILLLITENFSKAFSKLLTFSNHSFSHNLESRKRVI